MNASTLPESHPDMLERAGCSRHPDASAARPRATESQAVPPSIPRPAPPRPALPARSDTLAAFAIPREHTARASGAAMRYLARAAMTRPSLSPRLRGTPG